MMRTASLGVVDVSSDGVFPDNTEWNGLEDSTRLEKVSGRREVDLRRPGCQAAGNSIPTLPAFHFGILLAGIPAVFPLAVAIDCVDFTSQPCSG